MKKMILAMTLAGGSFAHAGDIKVIEKTFAAWAFEAVSTMDQRMCAGDALKASDKMLNEIYQEIKSPLVSSKDADSKEILNRLVTSQRAWITYRDTNCELAGTQMLGGSGEGVIIGDCLASETIKRVKDLSNLLLN